MTRRRRSFGEKNSFPTSRKPIPSVSGTKLTNSLLTSLCSANYYRNKRPSADEAEPLDRRNVIRFFPHLCKAKIPSDIQTHLVNKQDDIFGLSSADADEDNEGDREDSEND